MRTIEKSMMAFSLLLPLWAVSQGTWTQKSNYLGSNRYDFIGYAVGGKGYVGTGRHGGVFNSLSDWQEYDPGTNTWTQKTPLPMPFTGGSGFAAAGYGYATCGANDATYIYDTYEYNQIGNNWSTRAQFLIPRLYATGIGSGNFGYIVGGYDVMAAPMNDCWEFNQPANTWTQKAGLPAAAARYYATGFSVNGKVYVFGGTNGSTYLHDLWEFNPASNTWAQKASLPGVGRQQAQAFVINNEAYVVGGFPTTMVALKEVWKYNPAANQWTQMADLPGAHGLAGGAGFEINGSGFVLNGNGTTECWMFTPYVTGISDNAVNVNVSMYPNPASGNITVKIPAGADCRSAEIFNLSGTRVKDGIPFNDLNQTIDIRELPQGFYLLKIATASGTFLNGTFIKN